MTIPDELRRSTPRPVSLNRQGWKSILVFCLNVAWIIAVGAYLYAEARGTHRLSPLDWTPRAAVGLIVGTAVGLIRFRRQSRLLAYGRPTVACVTGYDTNWLRLLPWRMRGVACEFRLLSGSTCRITVDLPRRAKRPDLDAEIVVVYDPDEPEEAVLYPAPMLTIRKH